MPSTKERETDRAASEIASAVDRAMVQLALVPGVGARTIAKLLDRFGTASDVLRASVDELQQTEGISGRLAQRLVGDAQQVAVDELLQRCEDLGARLLTLGSANYPRPLRTLEDAPPLLFIRGHYEPRDGLAVAVVGTRHASAYGQQMAQRLVVSLVESGLTVVSGLARGIDATAHRAALDGGGRTIAVLGSGIGDIYPPEHTTLADRIAQQGAVISEFAIDTPPRGGQFPQRNRIISALSMGVVVVEASQRSGAIITARLAGEQGREVFAVPGPVTNPGSRGCHALLKDGARLVESIDDILAELGPLALPIEDQGRTLRHPAELQLNEIERQVLDAIATQPTLVDHVIVATKLSAAQVVAAVSALEIRRLARRLSGQLVVRI
jgi:DNA processing protein